MRVIEQLIVVMVLTLVMAQSTLGSAGHYYSMESEIPIDTSHGKIVVQLDTATLSLSLHDFFAAHPCIDSTAEPVELGRGFFVVTLTDSSVYDSAFAEVASDPEASRCMPLYVLQNDTFELPMSDLIAVQFEEWISIGTASELLSEHGLHFVDSSRYRHMNWVVAGWPE